MRVKVKNWGFFGMVILCVTVIAASGWWASVRFEKAQWVSAAPAENQHAENSRQQTPVFPVSGERIYQKDDFRWDEMLQCYVTAEMDCFASQEGEAVLAVLAGTVEKTTYSDIEGSTVEILHEDGGRSVYRGLKRNITVRQGQQVEAMEKLGETAQRQILFAFYEADEEKEVN